MVTSSNSANISNANIVYKANSAYGGANDTAIHVVNWFGPQEYRVLKTILDLGITKFSPKEIRAELGIDRRNLYHILQRLTLRGILKKIGRGLYQVVADLAQILGFAKIRDVNGKSNSGKVNSDKASGSQRQPNGTRIFVGGGGNGGGLSNSVELYFDNVRGYRLEPYVDEDINVRTRLRYVGGDRGRTLSWWEVNSLYERITYSEIGYRVFGNDPFGVLDGVVVIYTNINDIRKYGRPSIRVEYRPEKGYVKRNGLASTVKLSFHELLKAWVALTRALLYVALQNVGYLKLFASEFRSLSGLSLLCRSVQGL